MLSHQRCGVCGDNAMRVRTDCTGQPVTFSWDFGDGSKGGNDPKPSHVYDKPGDYIATVTASAPDGGRGTDEIDITVDSDLGD